MQIGTIKFVEGPNRTKRQEKANLKQPLLSPLTHRHSWVLGLWTWAGTYTIFLLGLGPLQLDWNYTTNFLWCSAYRWQTMGLLIP